MFRFATQVLFKYGRLPPQMPHNLVRKLNFYSILFFHNIPPTFFSKKCAKPFKNISYTIYNLIFII